MYALTEKTRMMWSDYFNG